MLEYLIISKTRIKCLIKFFLNSNTTAYLRNLESEFGESTNAIRIELNRLEKGNFICSTATGNKKIYRANTEHPFYPEIHSILLKHIGVDKIIDQVIKPLKNINKVFVTGDFGQGKPNKWIDLIIIGDQISFSQFSEPIQKTEEEIGLKIRFIIIKPEEENEYIKDNKDVFQIW